MGIWYLIAVFIIVLISGCAVNLLKRHFVIQLAGIAFLFTYSIFKSFFIVESNRYINIKEVYFLFLPSLTGIAACLVSMVLGFWVFPHIRKRIKN
jgi:fluoride ion exporter CrcB/FEX